MALDQRSNWTASMADNLQAVRRKTYIGRVPVRSIHVPERPKVRDTETREYATAPVYLPDEIILQILAYVAAADEKQQTLYSCCLLSHQWYTAAVPFLYERPRLYGKNFDPFVRVICPSVNLHVKKSPLSGLIRVLNMAGLVHHGGKSMTARLLGRTKESLEEFVAPQASFGIGCHAALSKCHRLRLLDLALVSESTPLQIMFNTVKSLENLTVLRLPRSSGFGADFDPGAIVWPPRLETLYLSGGIDAHFLYGIVHFPPTLHELYLEHCPMAKTQAVRQLLASISHANVPLTKLRVAHMPRLGASSIDPVLVLFPRLEHLSVSVDYITPAIFNPAFHDLGLPVTDLSDHALRVLEITNSGNPGVEDKFSPLDIIIAIDEGSLPNLRQVRVATSLGWQSVSSGMEGEIESLTELLQSMAKRDYDERRGIYADMSNEEWKRADWEKGSGVWLFDG
ncbi:hypothetical protein MBLNU459_g2363t1 [Dothideomycetes sp. NU459]